MTRNCYAVGYSWVWGILPLRVLRSTRGLAILGELQGVRGGRVT